jgi:hypothetical protein
VKNLRRLFSALRRNWKITAPAATIVAGAAAAGVLLLAPGAEPQAVTYANVSRNYRVCMLSTTKDADDANRAWPAIQAATGRAPINAQRVKAPAGTVDQLAPYLNSLLSLHCGLIIGAGPDLLAPIEAAAKSHPNQHFLASNPKNGTANVKAIPSKAEDLTAAVVSEAHSSSSNGH